MVTVMPIRPPLFRTARAVVFATVCITLTVLGHVLAGGAAVPGWAAVTGFGAVLGVTLLLAGHERSLATILGGLLGGQFALHTLFTHAAAHHAPAMHGAMAHGTDTAAPAAHGGGNLGMTLAHCAAALVAAWWLRRGERAAWTLARRAAAVTDRPIRLLLALLTIEAANPPRPVAVVPAADAVPAAGRVLRHQVVRRGPPARPRALAHH